MLKIEDIIKDEQIVLAMRLIHKRLFDKGFVNHPTKFRVKVDSCADMDSQVIKHKLVIEFDEG